MTRYVERDIAPGTGVEPDRFWSHSARLLIDLAPINKRLLRERDVFQAKIDAWHGERRGKPIDLPEYRNFLDRIGYIVPQGPAFEIGTSNVDPEIASMAGPQLVVPVNNARFALNADNARWGSLYDALYGTECDRSIG